MGDIRRADLLDENDIVRFWRRGHFAYESGDHGDLWLALELLVADPIRLRRAAGKLAALLLPTSPEVVGGALIGGALVGQEVAAALGVPFVYAEPRGAATDAIPPALLPLLPGKRVALVDDAINAGVATLATLEAVERAGGRVVAVAALIARRPALLPELTRRGIAVEFLVGVSWNTWPAPECPLCRAGTPLERP